LFQLQTIFGTGNWTVHPTEGVVICSRGLYVSAGNVQLPNQSVADGALTANIPKLDATNSFTGSNTIDTLTGSSGVTLPNQSVADRALSTNVVLKSLANDFTETQTYDSGVSSTVITGGYMSCNTLGGGVALTETFNTDPDAGSSKL
jgi:hypothetical protein